MKRIAPLTAAAFLVAAAAPLAAQQRLEQPATIPLELAQELVFGMGPGDEGLPVILVGVMADPLATLIDLPAGARVLGSVLHGAGVRAIVAVPGEPGEALRGIETRLLASGWRVPARPELDQPGFVPTTPAMPVLLCGPDDAFINLLPHGFARRQRTDGPIHIAYQQDARYPPCNSEFRRPMNPYADLPMPPLRPPPGAEIRRTGGGGGEFERDSRARIRFAGTAEELRAHFAEQLRHAGWREGARTVSAEHLVQSWRVDDAEGRPWIGLFLVMPVEAGEFDLLARVARVESPR
jgi:hypothetical protein